MLTANGESVAGYLQKTENNHLACSSSGFPCVGGEADLLVTAKYGYFRNLLLPERIQSKEQYRFTYDDSRCYYHVDLTPDTAILHSPIFSREISRHVQAPCYSATVAEYDVGGHISRTFRPHIMVSCRCNYDCLIIIYYVWSTLLRVHRWTIRKDCMNNFENLL